MTEHVAITGMTRIHRPKQNQGGSMILAHFEAEARGIRFRGCALAKTNKGGLAAWLPKLNGPDAERRSVEFIDDSLRHAMMLHARETYRALGGTDAEYIGSSIPNGPIPEDRDDG